MARTKHAKEKVKVKVKVKGKGSQKTQPKLAKNAVQKSKNKAAQQSETNNIEELEQKKSVFQAYHHIFVGDFAKFRASKAVK